MTSKALPMPFHAAASAFRARTITPRDYLERLIAATGLPEDSISAFATLDLEGARLQADASTERYARQAPLSLIDGLPMGIKDIIHTAHLPTGMGSALYDHWQPRANAACVDALIGSGAVLLGKTHTTEFAIGRPNVTRNPHDPAHSPGGSSSGTAAGVGAGMICAGLGTQTQGSIIRPASYCGVVGYKPTWGVLPLEGVHPVSQSHDHLGVIAQSIELAWYVAHCIMDWMPGGLEVRLPGARPTLSTRPVRRLGVLRTAGYDELNREEQSVFEDGLVQLERSGVQIVWPYADAALMEFSQTLDDVPDASAAMVSRDMVWPYADYCRRDTSDCLSKKIRNMVERGRAMSTAQYLNLVAMRHNLRARLASLAQHYDALVLPSSSGVAPAGLDNTGSRTLGVYGSFLGAPAVSLPAFTVGHLPMGLQLLGAPMGDYSLLCHALHVHEILSHEQ
ncbi:MAG TPA: amidase [Burkholderiaceae bacterium]|nr:amidase [Burkholderiaceae bacterium]